MKKERGDLSAGSPSASFGFRAEGLRGLAASVAVQDEHGEPLPVQAIDRSFAVWAHNVR